MTDLIQSTQALKTAFDKHYERVTMGKDSKVVCIAEELERSEGYHSPAVAKFSPKKRK